MLNPSCYAAMFAYALHLFAYRIDVGQVLFFTPRNAIYTGQDTLISENINTKDAIKRPLWRLTLLLNEQNNMNSALFSLKIIIIIYVAFPLRHVSLITHLLKWFYWLSVLLTSYALIPNAPSACVHLRDDRRLPAPPWTTAPITVLSQSQWGLWVSLQQYSVTAKCPYYRSYAFKSPT